MNNKPPRTANGVAAIVILCFASASILAIAAVPLVLTLAYFFK